MNGVDQERGGSRRQVPSTQGFPNWIEPSKTAATVRAQGGQVSRVLIDHSVLEAIKELAMYPAVVCKYNEVNLTLSPFIRGEPLREPVVEGFGASSIARSLYLSPAIREPAALEYELPLPRLDAVSAGNIECTTSRTVGCN